MRNQAIVRNPVLSLPASQGIALLPSDARDALRAVLLDLRREAAEKAQREWKRNKGMTAAYWKAVSIYAWHISRLCRNPTPSQLSACADGSDNA